MDIMECEKSRIMKINLRTTLAVLLCVAALCSCKVYSEDEMRNDHTVRRIISDFGDYADDYQIVRKNSDEILVLVNAPDFPALSEEIYDLDWEEPLDWMTMSDMIEFHPNYRKDYEFWVESEDMEEIRKEFLDAVAKDLMVRAIEQVDGELPDEVGGDAQEELIADRNYGYVNFVEDFTSNRLAMHFFAMSGQVLDSGIEPDAWEYGEIMLHMMMISDLENAGDTTEQTKAQLLEAAAGISREERINALANIREDGSLSSDPLVSEAAINAYLMEGEESWAEAVANLNMLIKDTARYDKFLHLTATHSDGDLQAAALLLRGTVKRMYENRLQMYSKETIMKVNAYGPYFFSPPFIGFLKGSPDYSEGSTFEAVIDGVQTFMEKVGWYEWDWEEHLEQLEGGPAVSGADLMDWVRKLMAVSEIGRILGDELERIDAGTSEYSGTGDEEQSGWHIITAMHLLSCRQMGEYYLSGVVAEDTELEEWFEGQFSEDPEDWYEERENAIGELRNSILETAGMAPKQEGLNQSQLEDIRKALGVPDDLPVEVQQSEIYYWEGADRWLIYVDFMYQGEMVASVEADAYTGEPLRGFFMYSSENLPAEAGRYTR